MNKSCSMLAIVLGILVVGMIAFSAAFTVGEQEQVVITEFGKPKGEPITAAGLYFRIPLIQMVNRFEKRILEWDGPTAMMTTKNKVFVMVDAFGRWRITDPLAFLQQLRDERSAQSRLDDILNSEIRNVIARHDFIEVIRSTKDRKVAQDESTTDPNIKIGVLEPITKGRSLLEKEIFEAAVKNLAGLKIGVDLLDVRFKRVNYHDDVSQPIYERMKTERLQIAELYRSQGRGDAAKKIGEKERKLKEIESGAYRKVQEIEGAADAKATEIYAKAYNQSPDALALFEFLRTMDTYKKTLTSDTTLILTTDSELLKYLKTSEPKKASLEKLDLSKGLQGLQSLPSLLDIGAK